MKRLIRSPIFNAACISLFTFFYASIFIITSDHLEFNRTLYYGGNPNHAQTFMTGWSAFLASGRHIYIAAALAVITVLVVLLLVLRRRPYDEYHAAILLNCLVAAVILTLIAIGIFYLLILSEPSGIVEKFTLFIVVHWTTIVLSDLVFVLMCSRR